MIGKTIAHYRIVERLGRGAMGEVYRAEDTRLRRSVVLKFLIETEIDNNARRRFQREAQAVSRLDHPNICTVYEINEAPNGRMYIVMGFYEGESLGQRLKRGPIPILDAIEAAIDMTTALDYAHGRGVIHRDLKPANIMIEESGNIRIVDFGLAKLADHTSMTGSGTTVGTLAYMSPEQATGRVVDGRSDIFSLGSVMCEMLTGNPPFEAEEIAAILYKILNVDPAPLSKSRPDIPAELESIVMRALAKDPAKRYQAASEMRDDLLSLFGDLDPARASRWRQLHLRVRSSRSLRPVLIAVAGGIALIAAVAIFWNPFKGSEISTGHSAGIEVMPFTADKPQSVFARGLEKDIHLRLLNLSGSQEDMWLVPEGRGRRAKVTSVQEAASKLGVGRVVAGSCREKDGVFDITVNILDATSGDIRRSETVHITDTDSIPSDPIAMALLQLFDLPRDTRTVDAVVSGTSSLAAYRSYVTGMGLEGGTERLNDAIDAYRRATAEDSAFAMAHTRLGLALLRTPELNDSVRSLALGRLQTAARLAPDVSYVHRSLGQVLSSMGDFDGAFKHLDEAARLNPSDPFIYRFRARTFQKMERPTEAEHTYIDEINALPEYWGGYEDLGYFYYSHGRFEEAITQFLRVRALVPEYAPTYNYLGALYQTLDRWDEAMESFEKSFSLGKNYAACANLGTCYYMFHRFEDAAAMYELALEYDRNNYVVVGNLGDAYYWIPEQRDKALGLFAEALDMARQRAKDTPDDAHVQAMIGGYQAALGDESAKESVQKALALDPDAAEINYRACVVYEIIGNRSRALALLGRALELGYSPRTIDSEPWLAELRQDSRYRLLRDEGKN